jgi:hypothetical protein
MAHRTPVWRVNMLQSRALAVFTACLLAASMAAAQVPEGWQTVF